MAITPTSGLRVPPELADAARDRIGEPDASLALLVRAGLAMLAGSSRTEALALARLTRRGRPRVSESSR